MFQNFNDEENSGADCGERVAALRAALMSGGARGGVDAFLVPREDEYQGEYVPPCAERLKWLTGFGGSAGLAIILPRRAALFVDGRYVLQAGLQVDKKIFNVVPSAEVAPQKWLQENMKRGGVVGLDPRLHSHAFVERLRASGLRVKFLNANPINKIWHDRPTPPQSKIVVQPLRLAGVESVVKRKEIGAALADAGVAATIITLPENIAWLLNIRGDDVPHTPFALSFGVLHKNGRFDWFIDRRRVAGAVRQHIGRGVSLCDPAKLSASLAALAGKNIGLEAASTPAWFVRALRGAKIIEMPDPCALPKACKNKAEIKGAVAAHIRDGVALCQFLAWLDSAAPQNKITEIDAAQKVEAMRLASGKLRDLSFDSISGVAANGAVVHYRVTKKTNRLLRAGDIYLLDSGGQYQDGTTDVTRTCLIGNKKPSREVVDRFTRVLRGHIALAAVQFPKGTTGAQLDALARAPLWAAGLDFAHGTGHGVGSYLSVHEGPHRISKGGDVALREGMIVSNEPGYYKAGAFGIRIENLQYVKRAGAKNMLAFETLTLAPIDRRLIDVAMLASDERDWLNKYHAQVYATIAPRVDAKTKRWLKAACANL